MLNEVWKNVKGFEGIYQVSNLGRVKRLPRYRNSKINNNTKTKLVEMLVTQYHNRSGYLRVTLQFNKKRKRFYTHRLVAEAFIENINNKPFINHINGIKDDNNSHNLEWCTASENQYHQYAMKKRVAV